MAKKEKFYVVWFGNPTGIFGSWEECQRSIKGVKGAQYMSFDTFADAKKAFGYVCQACGFDFEKKYGEVGKNYIECHHKNPLSEQSDLTPSTLDDVCMLCSNCHRMIHRTRPAMSLEQLRHILREMRERIDPWSDV